MRDGLLLGIDGGASKTAGVMMDCQGTPLAQARLGGSAIVGKPSAESCRVLASVVDSLCAQVGTIRNAVSWCGVGLNGVDFADELPIQHEHISRAIGIPAERVALVNDGIIALWGATPARKAVIIQHGSGFTAAYRSAYGREALFDHLSVARAFDMRSGLIAAAARMINGQVAPTPLKAKALAFFGIADDGYYCEAVYRDQIPRELRLGTVPLIYESWLQGDSVAADLVERAVEDYGSAASAMIAKTGSRSPDVIFGGGLLACAPLEFRELLTKRIRRSYPDITAKPPDLAPEFGAAIMAGYRIGLDADALFRGALCHSAEGPRADL